MKLFNFGLLISAAFAASDVEEWCGVNLHDAYQTDPTVMKYVKMNKKPHNNPDKPRRPGHWRVVVRPECVENARRGGKPGGYPDVKRMPLVKCTRKGIAGSNKTKPNARRYKASKLLEYQQTICEG